MTSVLQNRLSLLLCFISINPLAYSQAVLTNPLAGTVSNSAIKIYADEIYQFNQGAALISNNGAYALIDYQGNFIVPFGTYTQIINPNNRIVYFFGDTEMLPALRSGLFEVRSGLLKNGGYINMKGKVVYTPPKNGDYIQETRSNDEVTYGVVERNFATKGFIKYQDVFFDANGNNVRLEYPSGADWNEETASFREPSTQKYGFVNKEGDVFIKPKYGYARSFSNGLAPVLVNRDLRKWAYINMQNRLKFDRIFDEAYIFQNGIGYIYDANFNKDKLINTNGKTILPKLDSERVEFVPNRYRKAGNDFVVGLCKKEFAILDTQGNVYTEAALLKLFNISSGVELNGFDIRENQIFCIDTSNQKIGLLDFGHKLYIPPIFTSLSMFDAVTKLAYAKLILKEEADERMSVYHEGYINFEGVFVLLKVK